MNKILIVIDMQRDFVYGTLGTPETRAIVPKIKKKKVQRNVKTTLVPRKLLPKDFLTDKLAPSS